MVLFFHVASSLVLLLALGGLSPPCGVWGVHVGYGGHLGCWPHGDATQEGPVCLVRATDGKKKISCAVLAKDSVRSRGEGGVRGGGVTAIACVGGAHPGGVAFCALLAVLGGHPVGGVNSSGALMWGSSHAFARGDVPVTFSSSDCFAWCAPSSHTTHCALLVVNGLEAGCRSPLTSTVPPDRSASN